MTESMQATILLIDDEETILKMAGQRLRHAGYRVLTAANGTMGLVLAKAEHPDTIVLDVNMPSMNGHIVLQTLKTDKQTQDIPVIMLTAAGGETDVTNTIASGAACYLHKPYQSKELLEEVALGVERHALAHGRTPAPLPTPQPMTEEPGADSGEEPAA